MLALHRLIHVIDNFVIANGINVMRNVAVEGAMHPTFGSTTDGYLERAQWLQANQAVLAADLNGDVQISLRERVNLQSVNDDWMRNAA